MNALFQEHLPISNTKFFFKKLLLLLLLFNNFYSGFCFDTLIGNRKYPSKSMGAFLHLRSYVGCFSMLLYSK
jgi:hypothetical protein